MSIELFALIFLGFAFLYLNSKLDAFIRAEEVTNKEFIGIVEVLDNSHHEFLRKFDAVAKALTAIKNEFESHARQLKSIPDELEEEINGINDDLEKFRKQLNNLSNRISMYEFAPRAVLNPPQAIASGSESDGTKFTNSQQLDAGHSV